MADSGRKRSGACVLLEMEFSGGARAGISIPLLIESDISLCSLL